MEDLLRIVTGFFGDIEISGIAVGLVVATGVAIFSSIRVRSKEFLLSRRLKARLPEDLERYRVELEKDTLRIHHSWMKDEQVLEAIPLPNSF